MSNTPRLVGGVIHTYRKYDPQRFPLPAADPPDMLSPAFEHLLLYGRARKLTPEQLADAVELDPRQIAGLGPSLAALRALLEERKRKLLSTYETQTVRRLAEQVFRAALRQARPPRELRDAFQRAARDEQNLDFERLWYRVPQRSPFARELVQINERLVERDEVEELATQYAFTGRTALDVPRALEVKEELETIDRLLKQIAEAEKNARVYVIDQEALRRFADEEQLEGLRETQKRIEELLRRQAEEQGLLEEQGELRLSPKAYRLFQGRLLEQIFSELHAARSGRHHVVLAGDGAVELQRTKPYEFGDSLGSMDVTATLLNALLRERREPAAGVAREGGGPMQPVRLRPGDIEIHLTRNQPKCATSVLMDMSGSMRWDGLYVHVKRMALALHGLIRSEYPGDFVDFVEVATLAKRRHVAEIIELLPRPVTIREPVVRLRADMGDPSFSELLLPPHFTNLEHGLRLARQVLQVQDTPNRQIVLITDGLPTAHFEGQQLYMLFPPDARTAEHTLREGLRCRAQGIVINIFLLSTWAQNEEDVRFAHTLAESTTGRVFFVTGGELERFVVWDYVKRRRFILG
ncbi:MAG: hypothetical protein IPM18_16165 [Phycisphaerales bacterium]|nr:hypothetical protein [Phycisphaerales bacterium]